MAGETGTVVIVSVLAGSMVDRALPPAERGRTRRQAENQAKAAVAAQIARVAPLGACHVIALFGDVVSDTLLLATNLGADAVVMDGDDPSLSGMLASSPVPLVVLPPSG